ncbi:MAG TPA: hypothetical protein ENN21_07130 [Spirochaetes bacterium]|nr:hypothetical protein [Spirochaetota bacterium]
MNNRAIPVIGFLLLGMFFFAVGCTRGATSAPRGERLLADLLSLVGDAMVKDGAFAEKYRDLSRHDRMYRDPWGPDSARIMKVGFELDPGKKYENLRRCLYLGARRGEPVTITVPLGTAVPKKSRVQFALGGLRLPAEGRGRFTVTLNWGKKSAVLLDVHATGESVPERRWKDYVLDLPATGSEKAEMEFVFTAGSVRPGHLFVANPRVFTKIPWKHQKPNVIFIIVDALRADAVNAVLPKYGVTPRLDRLAGDGWTFRKHFVVSNWTRPSTIAALCSVYGSRSGVNLFYPPVSDGEREYFYKHSGIKPLASLLSGQGYISASIGNNAFIIDYTGIGIDLGFDEISEYRTQWEDTMDITAEVVSWLEKNRSRNFFLFINYNAPHNAYIPPPRYLEPLRKRFKTMHPWFRAYLGEAAYTDDYIGRVMDALKRLDLYRNTIVVVTADHGEVFSPVHEESPYTGHRARFSHGQSLYDEELHTPLIIKPQEGAEPATALCDAQVRSIDVVPTLLDLMKLETPAFCQGESLLPLLRGEEKGERVVYTEGRMMYGVRVGGHKYGEKFYGFGTGSFYWGGDSVEEFVELYDLTSDPGEERNLAWKDPAVAAAMKALLHEFRFKQPERVLAARGRETRGRVRVENGFFYDLKEEPSPSARRLTRREYRFTLPPGGKLIFSTIPADATVRLSLERPSALLAGPHLLPLVPSADMREYRIDTAPAYLHGGPQDEVVSLVDRGLLFWNVPGARGLKGVSGEAALSRDINKLLQRWGYIQGREKKEN